MSIVVWQGFDHYWQREPHRLNRFGAFADISSTQSPALLTTYLTHVMQIGRFPPDTCHAHGLIHAVNTQTGGRIDGLATATVEGDLGVEETVTGERITHSIPQREAEATVIMRGFELECVNFPHGFQTRGFGLSIKDIDIQAADGELRVSFVPTFTMFADKSPDPMTDPDRFIWKVLPFPANMEPNAPKQYAYEMKLYYSVVWTDPSRAAFTMHSVSEQRKSSSRRRARPQTIAGKPGFANATVGIRGFGWRLRDWPGTRYSGRYLRRVQFLVDDMDYDVETGTKTFLPKMAFSNVGGRAGRRDARDKVRRVVRVLRRRDVPDDAKMRSVLRSLRGSFGFDAEYEMDVTLMQFCDEEYLPVSRCYCKLRQTTAMTQRLDLPAMQPGSVA
jgi:hypothetical protein